MKKEMLKFLSTQGLPIYYEERQIIGEFIETFYSKPRSGEWISVEDRFPGDCDTVLIWSPGMKVISSHLVRNSQGNPDYFVINDWNESDSVISITQVTHWMPLPNPPFL